MSDLAATDCGCGNRMSTGNCSCNVLLWILILSCVCKGGDDNGLFGNGLFNGGCGQDSCGCGGNNFIWIIILIALIG